MQAFNIFLEYYSSIFLQKVYGRIILHESSLEKERDITHHEDVSHRSSFRNTSKPGIKKFQQLSGKCYNMKPEKFGAARYQLMQQLNAHCILVSHLKQFDVDN
jgi:hypothetical protein